MRFCFITFIAIVVSAAPLGAAEDAPRPNILVILADDLGYGDVGCFGGEDLQTPHIDGLAARGMRFTQFYANCTVCSPTHRAIGHIGVESRAITKGESAFRQLPPGPVA